MHDEVTAHGMPFKEYEHIIDTVAADLFTMRDKTPHGAPLFLMCNEDGAAAGWRGRKPNPNPNVPKPWPYIPYNLTHFSMDWYHDPTRSCRTDSDCDVPGVGTIGWCIAASDSDYAHPCRRRQQQATRQAAWGGARTCEIFTSKCTRSPQTTTVLSSTRLRMARKLRA